MIDAVVGWAFYLMRSSTACYSIPSLIILLLWYHILIVKSFICLIICFVSGFILIRDRPDHHEYPSGRGGNDGIDNGWIRSRALGAARGD